MPLAWAMAAAVQCVVSPGGSVRDGVHTAAILRPVVPPTAAALAGPSEERTLPFRLDAIAREKGFKRSAAEAFQGQAGCVNISILIEVTQAAFATKPCGSSTNLAAMPLSNSA